jgi:hypothetical protein
MAAMCRTPAAVEAVTAITSLAAAAVQSVHVRCWDVGNYGEGLRWCLLPYWSRRGLSPTLELVCSTPRPPPRNSPDQLHGDAMPARLMSVVPAGHVRYKENRQVETQTKTELTEAMLHNLPGVTGQNQGIMTRLFEKSASAAAFQHLVQVARDTPAPAEVDVDAIARNVVADLLGGDAPDMCDTVSVNSRSISVQDAPGVSYGKVVDVAVIGHSRTLGVVVATVKVPNTAPATAAPTGRVVSVPVAEDLQWQFESSLERMFDAEDAAKYASMVAGSVHAVSEVELVISGEPTYPVEVRYFTLAEISLGETNGTGTLTVPDGTFAVSVEMARALQRRKARRNVV